MQAGIVENRRTLASLLAAAVVASMFIVLGGSAADAGHEPPDDIINPATSDGNQTPRWVTYLADVRGIDGATCSKLDQDSSSAFVMPAAPDGRQWVLLVVKQATSNFLYYDPVGGHSYPSTGQQGPGYSHIIMCSAEVTTTTTEASTTSTSLDIGATSTTAGPTTTAAGPTTTLEGPTTTEQPTTTTLGDEVLNTTITAAPATTVADITSSTFEDEVLDEEILPFTGYAFEGLLIIASALALLGALLLSTRSQIED